MELEEFKLTWVKNKSVSYSSEELASIYTIKKDNSLNELKVGFGRDLIAAILLTVVFIAVLQYLNLRTSNFWSIGMAILGLQHILFYKLQSHFIRKYSIYKKDVSISLDKTIAKLNLLLWFYRLWPATLAIILYLIYLTRFTPTLSTVTMIIMGIAVATAVAILSYLISAIMVRRQYKRLIKIKKSFEKNQ